MIVHRDLKPANLMLGGIPHETGTRDMVRCRMSSYELSAEVEIITV